MDALSATFNDSKARISLRGLALLYAFVCFISGAAMMVIELAGIRLLAPFFGQSLYTWTALIGVVLISFSIGNYAGGWLADRTTNPLVLGVLLYCSALSTLIVPPLHAMSVSMTGGMGLVAGPTVLALVLFTLPGCALGAISPYATRLISHLAADSRIGAAAGTANMAGTFGSFVGTFASGFVLIPIFGVRSIFMGAALFISTLAIMVCLLSNVWPTRQQLLYSVLAMGGALIYFLGIRLQYSANVIDERLTFYHQILVTEEEDDEGQTVRRLLHDQAQQGALIVETGESPLPYQLYWRLSKAYLESLDTAIVIGGGTFGFPKDIVSGWPGSTVTTVEIDPVVIEVARAHFELGQADGIESLAVDARWHLNRTDERFDFIFGDAYQGMRTIPAHLTTQEFFSQVEQHLKPDGIYMMNVIGTLSGPRRVVFDTIYRTLNSVFDTVHVYKAYDRDDEEWNNLILVASDWLAEPSVPDPDNTELIRLIDTRIHRTDFGAQAKYILSDDHNPIEYLIASTLQTP